MDTQCATQVRPQGVEREGTPELCSRVWANHNLVCLNFLNGIMNYVSKGRLCRQQQRRRCSQQRRRRLHVGHQASLRMPRSQPYAPDAPQAAGSASASLTVALQQHFTARTTSPPPCRGQHDRHVSPQHPARVVVHCFQDVEVDDEFNVQQHCQCSQSGLPTL